MPRTALLDLPIDLDRREVSLHRAVYDALRHAMLSGRLGAGTRLPSSRELARQLAVARGTIVAVYDQLTSEGYLNARRGSGTAVAAQLPDRWFDNSRAATTNKSVGPRALRFSRWVRQPIETPFSVTPRRNARPLRPHVPAVDVFPVEAWSRLASRRARQDTALLLADGDVRGYAPLREVLAEHLRIARGVVCSADHVVILPSVQQAIDIVGRLTLDPGDEFWMEDPGYVAARALLSSFGAKPIPIPVDADGIDVAAGIARAPAARLAYVTPGHQAPLGVTMTLERRLALLAWASSRGAVVLEDDYDSEYRYEGRPVPALQGLDRSGVVVHVGTFSKTLLPSLRVAYVVVPDVQLDRFLAAKSIIDRFTPVFAQAVLCDFIDGGHFGRHLRRMREIYAERRAALLAAVESELAEDVNVVGARAGLDFTVRLRRDEDDRAICTALAADLVEVLPLSAHAVKPRQHPGLVLGFAPFTPARIRKSVASIREVLKAKCGKFRCS